MKIIHHILRQWKEESGIYGVAQFKYSPRSGILTIYTANPEKFIGDNEKLYNKYVLILKEKVKVFSEVKFVETYKQAI